MHSYCRPGLLTLRTHIGRKRWTRPPQKSSNGPRESMVFGVGVGGRAGHPKGPQDKALIFYTDYLPEVTHAQRNCWRRSTLSCGSQPQQKFQSDVACAVVLQLRVHSGRLWRAGRFCRQKHRHKNKTNSRAGGQARRPGTQGKRPKTTKTQRNSRTLPRPEGVLYQSHYRTTGVLRSTGTHVTLVS